MYIAQRRLVTAVYIEMQSMAVAQQLSIGLNNIIHLAGMKTRLPTTRFHSYNKPKCISKPSSQSSQSSASPSRPPQTTMLRSPAIQAPIATRLAAPPQTSRKTSSKKFKNNMFVTPYSSLLFPPPLLYRMEGTCIVEHWDISQVKPADDTNPFAMF